MRLVLLASKEGGMYAMNQLKTFTEIEYIRPDFAKIPAFIESEAKRITPSEKMNHVMWPITSTVNGDESMSFQEAVQRMKSIYEQKVKWLDDAIMKM